MAIKSTSSISAATGVVNPLQTVVRDTKGSLPVGSTAATPRVGALSAAANAARDLRNLDPALRPLVETANNPTAAPAVRGATLIPPTGTITPASAEGYADPAMEELRQSLAGYPSLLEDAQSAGLASLDAQQSALEDFQSTLQPQRSTMLGRAGAALLAPTQTGHFAEGLGNAFNAALDARDYDRKEQQALAQKRLLASEALAKLTGQRAQLPLDQLTQKVELYRTQRELDGQFADDRLHDGMLNPTDVAALIADYSKNPSKYAGSGGRAMIAAAVERQRGSASTASDRAFEMDKLREQSRLRQQEEAAKAAAEGTKPTPLDRSEASRVSKRLSEAQSSADEASALKADIANLRMSRDKTGYEGGWGADTIATVGGWVGSDAAANMQEVRANAEALRLALTQKTKGAISDSEMRIFGLATPGLNMTDAAAQGVLDAQEAAAERSVQKNMFLKAWVQANGSDYGADESWASYVADNPVISQDKRGNILVNKDNVANWKGYVTGPDGQPVDGAAANGAAQQGAGGVQPMFDVNALPQNVQTWAQKQLDSGIPAAQVIQHINDQISKQRGAQ